MAGFLCAVLAGFTMATVEGWGVRRGFGVLEFIGVLALLMAGMHGVRYLATKEKMYCEFGKGDRKAVEKCVRECTGREGAGSASSTPSLPSAR